MSDLLARLQAALGDTYRIEHELGGGGMSRLFLATEASLHRAVVIKLLPPEFASEVSEARFKQEIELAAHLQHPNILPVLTAGAKGDLLFYVMPFVAGESLRHRLTREGKLPVADAVTILLEMTDALAYAHAEGVIHRDVKPENILLEGGHAVLTDFGVARALADARSGERLTETGISVGTPAYMSPEQAAGERHIDARADVYALAVVGYEMLAGVPPFSGPTAQAVITAQMTAKPRPLRDVRPETPPEIERAIMQALSKDPGARPRTAAEFRETLGTRPVAVATVSSGRWFVLLGGVAVLVILAAFVISIRGRKDVTSTAALKMIVVLPFENLGPPEDEYFADGMTEEVTARLAGLHGLGVIGRTSAMQYKKTTKTIAQIGQELGVAYVLEGAVRWDKPPQGPSRVRVTPQLIRVSDAIHMWAHVYDAVVTDVFDVQANIATQVADTLGLDLLTPELQALAARPTANLEAYDYYLRGNDYDTRGYAEDNAQLAVRMYERAVQLDPKFALAYDKLARAKLFLSWTFDRTEELVGAKDALDRAQQLGPDLAETHLALGFYYYWRSRDYDHALEQFALVRERQPNDPDVVSAIGYIHRRRGQWTEAVRDLTRAMELDPRDHSGWYNLALTFGPLRRYPEAERSLERAISLAPDVPLYHSLRVSLSLMEDGNAARAKQVLEQPPPSIDRAQILVLWRIHTGLLIRVFAADYGAALTRLTLSAAGVDSGSYYLAKADAYAARSEIPAAQACYDSARAVLETKLAARPTNKPAEQWPVEVPLAWAYAGLGRKADAIRLARAAVELLPVSRDAWAGPIARGSLAEIYMRTGKYDAALDQLEYLLSIPSWVSGPLLRVDPLYTPLRGNPRFERLLRGSS